MNAALKKLVIGYVIILHLFVVVLIFKTNFLQKINPHVWYLLSGTNVHVENMQKFHLMMDPTVPENATIFLGDSLVQGLTTAAVAPYTVNFGIGGESSTELLQAIPHYKSLHHARQIVLSIGINDLSDRDAGDLVNNFSEIIAALPRQVPIVWSSVMPVENTKVAKLTDIMLVNQAIKYQCSVRGNCVYVDTWSFLTDENGKVRKGLFMTDGLHLNREGYKLWINALRRAIGVYTCNS